MYEVLLELDDLLETLTYWLFRPSTCALLRLIKSTFASKAQSESKAPSRKQPGRSPGKERMG